MIAFVLLRVFVILLLVAANAFFAAAEFSLVSVRDTRTRWGSCSTSGNLCFSWRLIFAPEEVVNYVVAHEVAHLVHMNHGKRFWRLVERLCPGAERQRRWLNRNRAQLLRIG